MARVPVRVTEHGALQHMCERCGFSYAVLLVAQRWFDDEPVAFVDPELDQQYCPQCGAKEESVWATN